MKAFALACSVVLCGGAIEADPVTEIPNPAAVFCVETGGAYSMETTAAGTRGLCTLPDGRVVDAWEHFRDNWDTVRSQ